EGGPSESREGERAGCVRPAAGSDGARSVGLELPRLEAHTRATIAVVKKNTALKLFRMGIVIITMHHIRVTVAVYVSSHGGETGRRGHPAWTRRRTGSREIG